MYFLTYQIPFRLVEHTRAHANTKSFICSQCGKGFSRYSCLINHIKTHNEVKTHECEICGKK